MQVLLPKRTAAIARTREERARGRMQNDGMGEGRNHGSKSSRRGLRPSFALRAPSLRTEGAGKAGWPQHPGPSRRKKLRERKNHRYGGDHTGLPCAMVYGL